DGGEDDGPRGAVLGHGDARRGERVERHVVHRAALRALEPGRDGRDGLPPRLDGRDIEVPRGEPGEALDVRRRAEDLVVESLRKLAREPGERERRATPRAVAEERLRGEVADLGVRALLGRE